MRQYELIIGAAWLSLKIAVITASIAMVLGTVLGVAINHYAAS